MQIETLSPDTIKITPPTKLKAGDFAAIAPQIDELIRQQGQIRLLIDASALHGWENSEALEKHILFVKNHQRKVKRIAVLAGHDWQRNIQAGRGPSCAASCRPLVGWRYCSGGYSDVPHMPGVKGLGRRGAGCGLASGGQVDKAFRLDGGVLENADPAGERGLVDGENVSLTIFRDLPASNKSRLIAKDFKGSEQDAGSEESAGLG